MRQIVRFTDRAVRERWAKFTELFDTVSSTVCGKFMAYMHRRGHQVRHRRVHLKHEIQKYGLTGCKLLDVQFNVPTGSILR